MSQRYIRSIYNVDLLVVHGEACPDPHYVLDGTLVCLATPRFATRHVSGGHRHKTLGLRVVRPDGLEEALDEIVRQTYVTGIVGHSEVEVAVCLPPAVLESVIEYRRERLSAALRERARGLISGCLPSN